MWSCNIISAAASLCAFTRLVSIAGRGRGVYSRRHSHRGVAIVECTVVLFLILLLTMGLIDCGVVFRKVWLANSAVRNAARASGAYAQRELSACNQSTTDLIHLCDKLPELGTDPSVGEFASATFCNYITENNESAADWKVQATTDSIAEDGIMFKIISVKASSTKPDDTLSLGAFPIFQLKDVKSVFPLECGAI